MARSISSDFKAKLADPSRNLVALYVFEFGTGTYALWTGSGQTTFNGLLFQSGGSVIDVDELEESSEGTVSRMVLKLSASPEKGITDDVLVRLYDEDWHMKLVTLMLGHLDRKTGLVVEASTLFRGRIEDAPFEESPNGAVITANCVSKSIDLSVPGGQYRNDATQKLIDPTDTSLVGIGTLNGAVKKDARWGQG
ncbi:hypothetical protein [Maritalea sp.]|uniref:hypothetical protein n=1 Tax=Maritalea sp. TaxID=2003361 RepID=UPI003EF4359F